MIKIGIYGDSFADPEHGHYGLPELSEQGWPNLLKKDYDVTVHAIGGSSVYFSYKEFLKTNVHYDKIIFVITNTERWPVTLNNDNNLLFVPSVNVVSRFLEYHKNDREKRKKLLALRDYFLYLYEDLHQFYYDCSQLMISHIKQVRPDVIFITFDQMLTYLDGFYKKVSTELSDNFYSKYEEIRCTCHFSAELNEVLYCDAKQAIETGHWTVSDLTNLPDHQPFNYYFKTRT